jgi:hypothetical protein
MLFYYKINNVALLVNVVKLSSKKQRQSQCGSAPKHKQISSFQNFMRLLFVSEQLFLLERSA